MSEQGFLHSIDRRLQEIEEERELLLRLRRLHTANGSATASNGKHQAAAPQPVRDLDLPQRVLSFGVRPGRQKGPKKAILDVVTDRPGMDASEMITQASHVATSQSKDVRRLLSWTASEMVRRGLIEKREGRFYPKENGKG